MTDQYTELLNSRIRDRNVQPAPNLLSFYPKSTRFIHQPVVDTADPPIPQVNGNWQKYSVDRESELNNQLFQLNSNVYIPSSTSDMYSYPTISNNHYTSLDTPFQKGLNEYIFNNTRMKG
jgi:hypothetical protein